MADNTEGRNVILYLHEVSRVAGAEQSLFNLARFLDRSRFIPVFAIPQKGEFSELLTTAGVETVFTGFPPVRGLSGVLASIQALNRLIREKRVALIHSNSIRTHFYGAVCARVNGIPAVWHQRNMLADERFDPDRMLSAVPDAIICNSRAVSRRFTRGNVLPAKVSVVFNGVDTAVFRPGLDPMKVRGEFGIPPGQTVVGMASRFNRNKGHESFIEAARIIFRLPGTENLRFMIVGGSVFEADATREKILRSLVNDAGLGARVIFTGPRRDMPDVYAAMDIFVLASESEACGRVVLEAMASGKPVIATDTGGTPEMISEGSEGLLFAPGDAAALAEKIRYLAGDPAAARGMGTRARQRAEKEFDIRINVRGTEEIYRRLLKDRPRRKGESHA